MRFKLCLALSCLCIVLAMATSAVGYGSYTVTTTADDGDGSLRHAIESVNVAGCASIIFNIPTTDPGYASGVFTIRPTSALPDIATSGVYMDGATQATFTGDTNTAGPEIVLDGSLAGSGVTGLVIRSGSFTLRNLVVNNWSGHGVTITGVGTSNNVISGCYIGTNASGTAVAANGGSGVVISAGAKTNTIGAFLSGTANVISGNGQAGVDIADAGTTGNTVLGNYIGTNVTGTAPIPNGWDGVLIANGASGNRVGGWTTSARNVISGNGYDAAGDGVQLVGAGTSGNTIQGNYIGVNASGTAAIPNKGNGVLINSSAYGNTIGSTASETRNIISGNAYDGVSIWDSGTTGNMVFGNYIGTNASGYAAIKNTHLGVRVDYGASYNTIGSGAYSGSRNLISGNGDSGVGLYGVGTSNNLVQGNYVGTDATGLQKIPNGWMGVDISWDASNNTVGGTVSGAANVISGNAVNGVQFYSPGTTGNVVMGNFIGTDSTGSIAVPNSQHGVAFTYAAHNNTVGGTAPGAGNVISGNLQDGVSMSEAGVTGNLIQGNYIGTNASGLLAIPNLNHGMLVLSGASSNTIGGDSPGAGNVISGNAYCGIWLDQGANGNSVQGNYIGAARNGSTAIPNGWDGVTVYNSTTGTTIGGTASGKSNVIAFNLRDGVRIWLAGATGNKISGNSIHDNGLIGINLYGGTQDSYGVTANHSGAASGPNNLQNYPSIFSADATGNTVQMQGCLTALPSSTYTIEFFISPTADPSHYGEGQTYIGSTTVTTDASGTAGFYSWFSAQTTGTFYVSATATDANGNTSEFSNAVAKGASSPVLTMQSNGPAMGVTTPPLGGSAYEPNTVVTVKALALPAYAFDHWIGDVANPTASMTTVTMNQSKTVTACFVSAVSAAKRLKNSLTTATTRGIVTAISSVSYFYIEAPDRSSGVQVYKTNHGVSVGETVEVSGPIMTMPSGERSIRATTLTTIGAGTTNPVKPICLTTNALGGGDWYFDYSTGAGQRGVKDNATDFSLQPNNIDLLVTVVGKVVFADPANGYFYIYDGKDLDDGSGYLGVKVMGTVPAPDPLPEGWDAVGHFVAVTGISSSYKHGSTNRDMYRLLLSTQVNLAD